jgi:phosphate:Na+ symporter
MNRLQESGKKIKTTQRNQLIALMTLCDDALTQMVTVMSNHRHDHDIRETYRIENEINLMRQQLRHENIRAVNEREYDYVIGTIYIDLINECEKLGDYVVNVVEARFGR